MENNLVAMTVNIIGSPGSRGRGYRTVEFINIGIVKD